MLWNMNNMIVTRQGGKLVQKSSHVNLPLRGFQILYMAHIITQKENIEMNAKWRLWTSYAKVALRVSSKIDDGA